MRHITEDENISKKEVRNLIIFVSVFGILLIFYILFFHFVYTIYDFLVVMGLAFFGTIPAFLANGFMPITGSIKKIKSYPVDGGRSWRGKRIFGPGKTWNGFIGGVILGFLCSYLLSIWIYPKLYEITIIYMADGSVLEFIDTNDILFFVNITENPLKFNLRTFLLCIGSPIGDLVGSFTKRRMDRPRGSQVFVIDQVDFILVSILLAYPVFPLGIAYIIFLFLFTPLITVLANVLGYYLKAKDVPW
ncbi:MAG: CDP-archaeol synthase [Candidatus Lokiarchaeota archaeon]|nr:CDP-archaeol synthase [Candidatus Lokiarchaeota archaeon]